MEGSAGGRGDGARGGSGGAATLVGARRQTACREGPLETRRGRGVVKAGRGAGARMVVGGLEARGVEGGWMRMTEGQVGSS